MNTKKTTNEKKTQLSTVSLNDLGVTADNKKPSSAAFSTWVRTLLLNWRQGTVSCKGRSDVSRTNKKPFKQKGTGRARAGTARSPLWRGGGVTFGPQPRTRSLKVNQKVKRAVLRSILSDYADNKRIVQLDWAIEGDAPKTSAAYTALKNAQLHDAKLTVFVAHDDSLTRASLINIPNVHVLSYDQPNAFDLATSEYWVVLKKNFDDFKQMALQWN